MDGVGFKKITHAPLEQYITLTEQTSGQLSKLMRLTACKQANNTISLWYRTVYITCLVASFDAAKRKR